MSGETKINAWIDFCLPSVSPRILTGEARGTGLAKLSSPKQNCHRSEPPCQKRQFIQSNPTYMREPGAWVFVVVAFGERAGSVWRSVDELGNRRNWNSGVRPAHSFGGCLSFSAVTECFNRVAMDIECGHQETAIGVIVG